MINLFAGEAYRILHKRNMYKYVGAVLLGIMAITFMRSGGFTESSIVDDAANIFPLMPTLLGGYFFTSIFSDDLTSKNLITLVGYGTSRATIVLTKLALLLVFVVGAFLLLTGMHLGVYALLGYPATGAAAGYVIAFALQNVLLTMGFGAIAAIVVYGTQKPTFAAVTYFMLAFNVVTMLLRAVAGLLEINIAGRLISGTTDSILLSTITPGAIPIAPVFEYLAYLAIAVGAAIFVFRRREMEF